MAPTSLITQVCILTAHELEAVARRVVSALGNMKEHIAFLTLKAATDSRTPVRKNTIKALGQLGAMAVEPLIKVLDDTAYVVQEEGARPEPTIATLMGNRFHVPDVVRSLRLSIRGGLQVESIP